MSEEILKALMQLFAIIAKQDKGVCADSNERSFVIHFLNTQLNREAVTEYIQLFDHYAGLNDLSGASNKQHLTSVKDSVKILGICRKINKTLNQEQKIIVLVRLYEMVNVDRKFTSQRMAIINTVAEVFRVPQSEVREIQDFVIEEDVFQLDYSSNLMIVDDYPHTFHYAKLLSTTEIDGRILILHVVSVDLYFLKYLGNEELYLNGLGVNAGRIYVFPSGSTVKLPKGKPLYYSDVVAHYLEDVTSTRISYHCEHVSYKFPNGNWGVRDVYFSENQGKLLGIVGASGVGKTTLLHVLSGLEWPHQGKVLINGYDLHRQGNHMKGVLGLVPQDDLLIEELTIFQNLYFNAQFCFKDKSDTEITELVDTILENLNLLDYKNFKVGSPLKNIISGGQRKRLNIALELIREPSILFVDEPTTGLSSRDSENVMDLLRELSLKGKLVIVVIHQPSSEIFKMFDSMMVLDVGGRMVYYGNPIESVMYFKRMDAQINSEVGECPTCGTVNPEIIFNIIEARVVDEFGRYTEKRKVLPEEWKQKFEANVPLEEKKVVHEPPPKTLNIPGWIKQFAIYGSRDVLSKISNKQYLLLTLLEAPVLGFILSFIVRYVSDPESGLYIFRENDNIPRFIFMGLIVALFLGLVVSAEEIFRDKKLLNRERFLHLSRSGYLVAKICVLFLVSAIQTLLFVLVANHVLAIKGMMLEYWLALFSTAAFANLLGLNISASFNSVVTIYIMIPLVMIPMMILSGAMFEFDKLNRSITSVGQVPVIAELMPTKWSYEALMVKQFKDNRFEKRFYEVEKKIHMANFKKVHYLPLLRKHLEACRKEYKQHQTIDRTHKNLQILKHELEAEKKLKPPIPFEEISNLTPSRFDHQVADKVEQMIGQLERYYTKVFTRNKRWKERKINYWLNHDPAFYKRIKNNYHNEAVADRVKQVFEENKLVQYDQRIYQKVYPVFNTPVPHSIVDFRTHFFAPQKFFLGQYIDTYWFNIGALWVYTFILYLLLYYDGSGTLMRIFSGKKI